jgi:hypothetical protein
MQNSSHCLGLTPVQWLLGGQKMLVSESNPADISSKAAISDSADQSARQFWEEGQAYLKVVRNAWPKRTIFTPAIIYQISAMAIEKLCMAYLTQMSNLPDNHTLRDLVRALDRVEALPQELRFRLMRMDRFMDLCPLVPMNLPEPSAADVPEFLATAAAIEEWLNLRYG